MISFSIHTKVRRVLLGLKKDALIKKSFLTELDAALSEMVTKSVNALLPADGVKQFLNGVPGFVAPRKKDKDIIVCRQRVKEKVEELAGENVLITKAYYLVLNSYAMALVAASVAGCKGVLIQRLCPLVAKTKAEMSPEELAEQPDSNQIIVTAPVEVTKSKLELSGEQLAGAMPMAERQHQTYDFTVTVKDKTLAGRKHFFTAMPESSIRQSILKQVVTNLSECGLIGPEDPDIRLITLTKRAQVSAKPAKKR